MKRPMQAKFGLSFCQHSNTPVLQNRSQPVLVKASNSDLFLWISLSMSNNIKLLPNFK
jgi:hypothetical protein